MSRRPNRQKPGIERPPCFFSRFGASEQEAKQTAPGTEQPPRVFSGVDASEQQEAKHTEQQPRILYGVGANEQEAKQTEARYRATAICLLWS